MPNQAARESLRATEVRSRAPGVSRRGKKSIAAVLLSLAISTLAIGCNNGPNIAPVSGTVTVDGKPLGEAGVTFTPLEGGRPAWATTDAEGHFQLTTLRSGDGAFVGEHVVTVAEPETDVPIVPKNADPDAASLYAELPVNGRQNQRKGMLDPKFASRDTSGLSFVVKPYVDNVAELNLTN